MSTGPADLVVASSPLSWEPRTARGSLVDLDGERFVRIENVDTMPPFLMSIVSDSDHWVFVCSNGGITAGRRNADHALFPYTTDDRVRDGRDHTGPLTILRVERHGRTTLWEPLSDRYAGLARVSRHLSKSVYGNKVRFEETHHDLGLTFAATWMNSERFGFVRRVMLRNEGDDSVRIGVLDGLQNLLPHGIDRRFQQEYSTLADGYKDSELEPATGLGIFRLSSVPTDKAEPSEALAATTVWCEGLPRPTRLLCTDQVETFRRGGTIEQETRVRGRRGAFLASSDILVAPGATHTWHLVAEIDQDVPRITALIDLLSASEDLPALITADVERGTRALVEVVAQADGLQVTEDEATCWRHFSNALFNVMRGGIPDRGYAIDRDDFLALLEVANRRAAARHRTTIEAWARTLAHADLLRLTREGGDPDLERIGREYLPLTFSRRHGDPSRPWNAFSIDVKDAQGRKKLAYQGNWRDIFQNWEALAYAFPGYVESMIFKFLDSSTADGYNPYRLTRDGFEWEVIDPNDAWSHIGYWGDHQVIYLLKLLEVSERFRPGALSELLDRRVFTYANVPYRLRTLEEMLANPRHTIQFDPVLHRRIESHLTREGSDAKALRNDHGAIARGSLAEKLSIVVLARLFSFVPEAGIWMNTQRPEWNDANNALVGYGVSVVTLCYLRRFLTFCRGLFEREGGRELAVASDVATAIAAATEVLGRHADVLERGITDASRRTILAELAGVGDAYRNGVYGRGISTATTTIAATHMVSLCDAALRHVDHSIRANRRDDGLYHAYNLIATRDAETVSVRRLQEMLEGQVAVLSSGLLSSEEALEVLDALRGSRLYRVDQGSYLLYPDRHLPSLLEKNVIPPEAVERSRLLQALLERSDARVVTRDARGSVHFAASIRNARILRDELDILAREDAYASFVQAEANLLVELYEQIFDHHSFTGRSGTFYKYEGLGCIYWHMVSKLVIAAQEILRQAEREGAPAEIRERIAAHEREIRAGIGVHKPPDVYGAFPTDPYSHTPSFAGAQQPGMTGQVKEDLIARLDALGVRIEDGRIVIVPNRVPREELLTSPGELRYHALGGCERTIALPPGALALTLCQVPIVLRASDEPGIVLSLGDGSRRRIDALTLDAATSASVFGRDGHVEAIEVHLPPLG